MIPSHVADVDAARIGGDGDGFASGDDAADARDGCSEGADGWGQWRAVGDAEEEFVVLAIAEGGFPRWAVWVARQVGGNEFDAEV